MALIDLSSIQPKVIVAGYPARFVHTDSMTLSFLTVKAGASLPTHAHIHEQVSIVLEGRFQLTLADETIEFGVGEIVVIPSNVPHSGIALTDCKLIDVFNPIREDYQNL